MREWFDDYENDEDEERQSAPRCNRCGSTDVRWRQQTGKWVLFDSRPGVVHACSIDDDDMPEVKE